MSAATPCNGHFVRGLEDALRGEPEKMLFRQIFLDTAELARIVMEMPDVDPDHVGVTGWSQGGALTVACAALEPRIRRAAPVYPFLSDYQRVWEMDLAKDAYNELKDYFRWFNPLHRTNPPCSRSSATSISSTSPRGSRPKCCGASG